MKFDISFLKTAKDHRQADYDCGREWSCWCAACKCVKTAGPELLEACRMILKGWEKANIPTLTPEQGRTLESAIIMAEGGRLATTGPTEPRRGDR